MSDLFERLNAPVALIARHTGLEIPGTLLIIVSLILLGVGAWWIQRDGQGSRKRQVMREMRANSPASKKKRPRSHSHRRRSHALSGTYDDAVFTDPTSGTFRFPDYGNPDTFLCRIIDNTLYSEEMEWRCRSKEEREHFSVIDFESALISPVLEVDGFAHAMDRISIDELGESRFMHGRWSELETVLSHAWNSSVAGDNALARELETHGLMQPVHFTSDAERREHVAASLTRRRVPDLRRFCIEADLPVRNADGKLRKGELIDQLLEHDETLEALNLPRFLEPSASMSSWLDGWYTRYLDDIRDNLQRFHPLYHYHVWSAIQEEVDQEIHPQLKEWIQDILRDKPWDVLLTYPP
ncbi:MAG: hypothetical protein HQL50_08490 [Magnetococcales bacterium]|nr:hypothetical protein [Magnetococcales bacterium]